MAEQTVTQPVPSAPPVLAIEDLRVTFERDGRRVEAVRGVDLRVAAGRTLAVVGESGSGKSVSLLAATGLLGASGVRVTGRALHHGTDLLGLAPDALRRVRGRDIGFVFQDPTSSLHPLKTVGAQVAEAITTHRRVRVKDLRERVVELLDEVGIKDPRRRAREYPAQFSGGMRQRAMIAIAIALNPGLLVADEPTTALDVTVQASILELLQRLQRDHGTAVVLVSHDLAVVSDVADDVVVMRDGQVVETATADDVYERPQHPYTVQLLEASRSLGGSDPAVPPVVTPVARTDEPLLRTVGVRRDYRVGGGARFTALTETDLEVRRGEILGLVGESGSGKTTLGRLVSGLVRPSAGEVRLEGRTFNALGRGRPVVDRATRARVQVVFQDPYSSLNPRRRVADVLAEPYVVHGRVASSGQLRSDLEAMVEQVELPSLVLDRFPVQLSGGQRQRVAIARALALGPDLVVADEAVSALDVTTQAQIIALLRRLRDETGVALLFISHDLGVVADLCDRVAVMEHGGIVEHGVTRQVFADPQAPATRALLEALPGRARGLAPDFGAPTASLGAPVRTGLAGAGVRRG